MGVIHELGEEYRHFRGEHPRLRGLFLLGDLVGLLIKLALFAGFLFLCWYIVSRSPQDERSATPASAVVETAAMQSERETRADSSPELTTERIALLRQIAGQSDDDAARNEGLLGSVATAESRNTGVAQNAAEAEVEVEAQSAVQVDSSADNDALAGSAATDDILTLTDDVFETSGDVEDGIWVLEQDGGDFIMQLALTVNVQFLVDYAEKLPAEFVASIFPERRNGGGEIQYSLGLGSFPTKRSAEAALADLPSEMKRYGAHVRNFGEVQANVSTFLQ